MNLYNRIGSIGGSVRWASELIKKSCDSITSYNVAIGNIHYIHFDIRGQWNFEEFDIIDFTACFILYDNNNLY